MSATKDEKNAKREQLVLFEMIELRDPETFETVCWLIFPAPSE